MSVIVYYRDFNYKLISSGLFVHKEIDENSIPPTYSEIANGKDKNPILKYPSLIRKVREMIISKKSKYPKGEQKSKYFSKMIKEEVRSDILTIGLEILKKEKIEEIDKAKKAEEAAYEINENSHKIGLENVELQKMVTKDELTGIYNRRFIMEMTEKKVSEVKREIIEEDKGEDKRGNLGVLMIDIDFFKKVNDSFGHQVGDLAIKFVAQTIENNINRAGDILGRYGGEEFLLLLSKTDIDGAIAVGDRLRSAIEVGLKNSIKNELNKRLTSKRQKKQLEKQLDILENEIDGTISIGVSCLNKENNVDGNEIIHQADIALYSAKNTGRNKVVVSDIIIEEESNIIDLNKNADPTDDEEKVREKLNIKKPKNKENIRKVGS